MYFLELGKCSIKFIFHILQTWGNEVRTTEIGE